MRQSLKIYISNSVCLILTIFEHRSFSGLGYLESICFTKPLLSEYILSHKLHGIISFTLLASWLFKWALKYCNFSNSFPHWIQSNFDSGYFAPLSPCILIWAFKYLLYINDFWHWGHWKLSCVFFLVFPHDLTCLLKLCS